FDREAPVIDRRVDGLDVNPLGCKIVDGQDCKVHVSGRLVMPPETQTPVLRGGSGVPPEVPKPRLRPKSATRGNQTPIRNLRFHIGREASRETRTGDIQHATGRTRERCRTPWPPLCSLSSSGEALCSCSTRHAPSLKVGIFDAIACRTRARRRCSW